MMEALDHWLTENEFDPVHLSRTLLPQVSPLLLACQQGNVDIVKALLAQNADINVIDEYGNSTLWAACYAQSIACIQLLLEKGIDINFQNPTGNTVLMYAASSGKDDIVSLLLEAGANANITNQDGMTALDLVSTLPSLKLLRARTGTE